VSARVANEGPIVASLTAYFLPKPPGTSGGATPRSWPVSRIHGHYPANNGFIILANDTRIGRSISVELW
jgi:hypothetical protein